MFVASNFVSDFGDIAVLDNIEIIYENDPAECRSTHDFSNSNNNNNNQESSNNHQQTNSNLNLIGKEVGVDASQFEINNENGNGISKSLTELKNNFGNNKNFEVVSGNSGTNNEFKHTGKFLFLNNKILQNFLF